MTVAIDIGYRARVRLTDEQKAVVISFLRLVRGVKRQAEAAPERQAERLYSQALNVEHCTHMLFPVDMLAVDLAEEAGPDLYECTDFGDAPTTETRL